MIPEVPDESSTAGKLVQVPGADGVVEFHGILLSEVSTETDRPRWLEIELYKITDGTDRYVLHLNGRSVLYHSNESDCNTGLPTLASQLPGDAEPCFKCCPPRLNRLDVDSVVDLESDRHTVHVCADAQEVVDQLKLPYRKINYYNRAGFESRRLSSPAQLLLEKASPNDESIRMAISRVVRL